jgi:hypothetical protein
MLRLKKTRFAAAAALLSVVAFVAPAPQAQAWPTGCWAGGGGTYSTAICNGGTGSYSAWARCKQPQWPYQVFYDFGSYEKVGSGRYSVAICWQYLALVDVRGVTPRNS